MKLSKNAKIIWASVGGVLLLCAIIGSQQGNNGQRGGAGFSSSRHGDDDNDRLAQLQAQHAQLMQNSNACMVQVNEATRQTQMSLVNGGGVMPQPACVSDMEVWTAQAAMLEKEIHELATGDHSTQVIDYVPRTHDTSGTIDRSTRQSIRGTTLYRDESGETRELPIAPYYYRDRASGQIYPSDMSQAPADGHDYEQLQPAE